MNSLWKRSLLLPVIMVSLWILGCGGKADKPDSASKEESADRDSLVFEMIGRDSLTVFEVLQENYGVDYKSSAMGVFVRAIDSVEQSSEAYWIYSVNGEMPKISCDKYRSSAGDTIRWHLRKTGD